MTDPRWPLGILTCKRALTPGELASLRAAWNAAFGGPEHAPRVIILEEDLGWLPLGPPPFWWPDGDGHGAETPAGPPDPEEPAE